MACTIRCSDACPRGTVTISGGEAPQPPPRRYIKRKSNMIIRIEVSDVDLEAMECGSLEEFEEQIRNQLDNGVVTSDGGAGADWMVDYDLEVIKVD